MTEKTPRRGTVSYDHFIKAALTRFRADLAFWLVGERPVEVVSVDSALATASARYADKLLHLRFNDRPDILLHVEFQGKGDPTMPYRMAEYLSLFLKTIELQKSTSLLPTCVVVYLDPDSYHHDAGRLDVIGELGLRLSLRYKVVKL